LNKIKWVLLFGVPFVLMLTFLPFMGFYKKTHIIDGFFLIMNTLCLIFPDPQGDHGWIYAMSLGFFSFYLEMLIAVLLLYFVAKYTSQVIYYLWQKFVKPKE